MRRDDIAENAGIAEKAEITLSIDRYKENAIDV